MSCILNLEKLAEYMMIEKHSVSHIIHIILKEETYLLRCINNLIIYERLYIIASNPSNEWIKGENSIYYKHADSRTAIINDCLIAFISNIEVINGIFNNIECVYDNGELYIQNSQFLIMSRINDKYFMNYIKVITNNKLYLLPDNLSSDWEYNTSYYKTKCGKIGIKDNMSNTVVQIDNGKGLCIINSKLKKFIIEFDDDGLIYIRMRNTATVNIIQTILENSFRSMSNTFIHKYLEDSITSTFNIFSIVLEVISSDNCPIDIKSHTFNQISNILKMEIFDI